MRRFQPTNDVGKGKEKTTDTKSSNICLGRFLLSSSVRSCASEAEKPPLKTTWYWMKR